MFFCFFLIKCNNPNIQQKELSGISLLSRGCRSQHKHVEQKSTKSAKDQSAHILQEVQSVASL